MKELIIKGKQNILGKEVDVIEGGFGENQKVMLAKTIAEVHEVETKYINKIVNNNINRFSEHDLINLLSSSEELRNFAEENGLIGSNRTKDVFLLSERGYTKLVAMMDNKNEKKWEVMDKLIDEYFTMRKIIKSKEQLKAELLLTIYNGGQEGILSAKKLTEMEVEEKTSVLTAQIKENEPFVDFAKRVTEKGDNILVRELAKIISDEGYKIGEKKLYNKLRDYGYIFKHSTEPTQRSIDNGYFVVITKMIKTPYGEKEIFTTRVTPKGQLKIVERILKEFKSVA